MTNWHKWVLSIIVGFFGGVIAAASDHGASLSDFMRHGLIGAGPAVAALNVSLAKSTKTTGD